MANEADKLASCYKTSLQLARDFKLERIAFPNISTGVYGYPKPEAAEIAIGEVKTFLAENAYPKNVVFVVFDDENMAIYQNLLQLTI